MMFIPIIIAGTVYYTYNNYKSIKNNITDLLFGYVEVKCVNNLCNTVHKLSKNSYCVKHNIPYACNMGCTLSAFNQSIN